MDIQYMAESTGTVCSYITGYITKTERSHMQETWEAIASDKDLYSSLFSFGVKFLHSRECGLYENSGILLGDHFLSKSENVHWVNMKENTTLPLCKKDQSKFLLAMTFYL